MITRPLVSYRAPAVRDNRQVLVGELVRVRLVGERVADYALASAEMNPSAREVRLDPFEAQAVTVQAETESNEVANQGSSTPSTGPGSVAPGSGAFGGTGKRTRGVDLPKKIRPGDTAAITDAVEPSHPTESLPNTRDQVSRPEPTPERATPPSVSVPDTRDQARQGRPTLNDVVGYCVLLIRT